MRPIQQSSVSLGLIEVIPIKGRLNVFSRLFETSAGYSLEIFRGDIPITSITHRNPEKRWSWDILVEADTIVKVKLSPVFATFRGQLRTQLAIVINLAIERDYKPPVMRNHRFMARVAGVDDRQAPMTETSAPSIIQS